MNKHSKIFIAGARGLVGSAVKRCLLREGYTNLLTPTSRELDLTNQKDTKIWFEEYQPEYVFLCAAVVGGIKANRDNPVTFIQDNLLIQTNVMANAWRWNAKTLFLGSSCIYPKLSPQPIVEDYLLTGPLEETNKPYAVAKIAGLVMADAYNRQEYAINQSPARIISAMPTNLYGPGDNFDPEWGHVLPALIYKFHHALPNKPVTLWGTGTPRREFLFVDDLAEACLLLMRQYDESKPINIGTGEDIEIRTLAETIQKIVGHTGPIHWDTSMPDGTPRKVLDVSRIKALGWEPKVSLEEGIKRAYQWFLEHQR